jgi:hypothetical protein
MRFGIAPLSRRSFFLGRISPCAIRLRRSTRAKSRGMSAFWPDANAVSACVGGWRKGLSALRGRGSLTEFDFLFGALQDFSCASWLSLFRTFVMNAFLLFRSDWTSLV